MRIEVFYTDGAIELIDLGALADAGRYIPGGKAVLLSVYLDLPALERGEGCTATAVWCQPDGEDDSAMFQLAWSRDVIEKGQLDRVLSVRVDRELCCMRHGDTLVNVRRLRRRADALAGSGACSEVADATAKVLANHEVRTKVKAERDRGGTGAVALGNALGVEPWLVDEALAWELATRRREAAADDGSDIAWKGD